jgi:NhaP-type Na+/H+ or K+/H+ antiporter
MVSVDDASDQDAMRIALSGKASLNDGAALPFLVLALIMQGTGGPVSLDALAQWFTRELLWSLSAWLIIGGSLGWLLGLLGARMKSVTNDVAPSDFLALAIVALAFAIAEWLSASTFLAAFAAGLGLRHAELRVVSRHPSEEIRKNQENEDHATHPPAELLISPNRSGLDNVGPAESVGMVVSDALSFGDTLERLVAAALVFATGAALARHWSIKAIAVAAVLFIVVRPASLYITTVGSGVPRARRLLMGWLGIRGIGTINYLAYALTHGVGGHDAEMITTIAITTVAMSVTVHGASARPLMLWRRRRIEAARS